MKKLIFLDVDGVLNSRAFMLAALDCGVTDMTGAGALDPQAVRTLEIIHLEHRPDWVLSSVWRFDRTPEQMTALLGTHGFTGTIISATGDDGPHRGGEIQQWLVDHKAIGRPFVILDDDRDMGDLLPRLVWTTFSRGLEPVHVEEVRRLFAGAP